MTNDPFNLAFTDLAAFEDAEQASTLAHLPVALPFDLSTSLIIAGPFQGQDVEDVSARIAMGHVMAGRAVHRTVEVRRSWWRFWQQTSVMRISMIGERAGADPAVSTVSQGEA